MKKLFRTLKFLGAYLLITIVTAAGVVFLVPVSGSSANIGAPGQDSFTTPIESNFTKIVNNLMQLKDFAVDADIKVTLPNDQKITLDMIAGVHATAGFGTVAANAQLNLTYGQDNYNMSFVFVDNQLYLQLNDILVPQEFDSNFAIKSQQVQDIKFTTSVNTLTEAIGQIMSLLNIDMSMGDSFANFDMSMIATMLEDYQDSPTEYGYDVSIVVMGQSIYLTTDHDFNITAVHIPTINLDGTKLNIDLTLKRYEQVIEVAAPQDSQSYLDLAKVTNLIGFASSAIDNKFVSTNINASFAGTNIALDTTIDFADGIKLVATSNSLGDSLKVMYYNDTLYIAFGNVKVSTTFDELKEFANYSIDTILPQLKGMNINRLTSIIDYVQDLTNNVSLPTISTPSIASMIGLAAFINTDGDNLTFALPGIVDSTIVVNNGNITDISIVNSNFEVSLNNIDITRRDVIYDIQGYTPLQNILPTVKAAINTLTCQGINGDITFTYGDQTYTLNLKAKLQATDLTLSLSTVVFGKVVQIDIQNETLYLTIDQTKTKIPFNKAQDLLGLISTLFDIKLPTIDTNINLKLQDISLDFISTLTATGDNLTITGKDYTVSLNNKNGYINKVNLNIADIALEFLTLKCGNVNIDTIDDTQYTHYEDIFNFISNIKDLTTKTNFDLTVSAQARYNGQMFDVNILATVDTKTFDITLLVMLNINGETYTVNAAFVDKVLYINYQDLKVKVDKQLLDTIDGIINNIIPKYINIDNIRELWNSLTNVDINMTMPTIELTIPQIIELVKTYTNALRSIAFEGNTLNISVNLGSILNINQTLNLSVKATSEYVEVGIAEFAIDAASVQFVATISVNDDEILAPYDANTYKDINDYLKLVEVLDNTISSNYFDIGATVITGDYRIDTNIIADLTDDYKFAISTDSLGSPLDIKYVPSAAGKQDVFFVTFGNLKLNCSIEQLKQLYNYLTDTVLKEVKGLDIAELQPILDKIDSLLTQTISTPTIQIDNPQPLKEQLDSYIKLFNSITVTDSYVLVELDDISINLYITDNRLESIIIDTNDLFVELAINSLVYEDNFDINTNSYLEFDKVFTQIDALVSTLITKEIGGTVAIEVLDGDFVGQYTATYALSYVGNKVYFYIDTKIFNHDLTLTYQNGELYLKLDQLNIRVGWNERYKLVDYINNRFGTNFVFPDLKLGDLSSDKPLVLEDINIAMLTSITSTDTGLEIVLGDTTITFTNKGTIVTNITISNPQFGLNMNIDQVGSQVTLPEAVPALYNHYTVVTDYIDEVARLMESSKDEQTDQYSITGSAYLFSTDLNGTPYYIEYEDGSKQYKSYVQIGLDNLNLDITNNLLDQLAIDMSVTGQGDLYKNSIGGLDAEFAAYFNSDPANGGLYLNYNRLKAFLDKSSLANIFAVAKDLLPMFVGNDFNAIFDMIKFNERNDIYVELGNMPNISVNMLELIETYAPMLTSLELDTNKVLSIGFDLTSITDMFTQPIILKIYQDTNKQLHLACDNLFIGGNKEDGYKGISFDLTVDTIAPFVGQPKTPAEYKNYSRVDNLLQTLYNTLQDRKQFHLESVINLSILDILNWYLDLTIDIEIIDGKPVIAATIGEIPVVELLVTDVNNDVPYEDGDTSAGKDRYLTIYYKDNYVYFYRTEKVTQWFVTERKYEKKLKVSLQEFIQDPLGLVLQYGFGFKSIVMDPIREALAKSAAVDRPTDYSVVVNDFKHTPYPESNSQEFFIDLNLAEISKNEDLKSMQLTLGTTTKNNVEYLNKINFYMDFNIGISILLQTQNSSGNKSPITLNLDKGCDMTNVINYINNYTYAPGEEWHYYKGKWVQDAGIYTINYNTNYDGVTYDSVEAKVGSTITLPTFTYDKVVVNGNDRDTYKFVGWCTNANLTGKVYNGNYTVGRGGANLYAKWELVESIRSLNYYIDGNLVYTQTGNVGEAINYNVSLPDIEVVENGQKLYKIFNGWIDQNGVKVTNIMAETINIYPAYTTLYTWRTITYDANFTGMNNLPSYSNYNDTALTLLDPGVQKMNNDGWTISYELVGWYYDQACTQPCNINIMPDQNMTLYAKWQEVSRVRETKITVYDNTTAYSVAQNTGTTVVASSLTNLDGVNLKYVAGETEFYTSADFDPSSKVDFPTTMPEATETVLYVRNKYTVTINYYNNVDGTHTLKTISASLYQGESYAHLLPTQSNYEITYYQDAAKTIPTVMTAYYFDGYAEGDEKVSTDYVMTNYDLTITDNYTTTSLNYYKISFKTDYVRPSWWVSDGTASSYKVTPVADMYVLEGSSITYSVLTKKTSILNNSTTTVNINAAFSKKYGVTYNYVSAAWNTTACKNLDTSWLGKDSTAYSGTTVINGNTDLFVEWASA